MWRWLGRDTIRGAARRRGRERDKISGAAAMRLAYATTDDVPVCKLVDAPSIQFDCDGRARSTCSLVEISELVDWCLVSP